VPVRFHITFALVLVYLAVVAGTANEGPIYYVLYFSGIFSSVLIHELAHALVARRFGISTREIVMLPIGGLAVLERQPGPWQELWIAMAGPAVNLGLAILYFSFTSFEVVSSRIYLNQDAFADHNLLHVLGRANLMLGLFNLLPAFPMDGGRILRALLALRIDRARATRWAVFVGRGIAFTLCIFGLLNGFYWLVFISAFVLLGAVQEGSMTQSLELSTGYPVRSAMMTDIRKLPHGSTLREAADLLLATEQNDFPVLLGDQVLGVLRRSDLVRGLATGADAYVSEFMDRDFLSLPAGMDLTEALPAMTRGASAIVFEKDQLVGMLTPENIADFLLLRRMGLDPVRRTS
jgi:Zn-dependent protease/CBS domain-containing protein